VLQAALAALLLCAAQGAGAADPAAPVERSDPRLEALVAPDARFEEVAAGFAWVEGPLWRASSGTLFFTDIPANSVYEWRAGDGVRLFLRPSGYLGSSPFPGREPGANGLAFDPRGRLVLCEHGERRVTRLEAHGSRTVLADRFEGRRLNSPNDLTFHSSGDLYFTDPPYGLPGGFDDPARELPFTGVYRLRPDGSLSVLTREVDPPNGLAFSPDERTLYVAQSNPQRPLWLAFPVRADGSLGAARVFHDASALVRNGPGLPDGMEVDRDGNLFAAGPGGVYVFAPDGTLLGRLVTGVATANVAFGGDGSDLYVAAGARMLRLRLRTKGRGY
jgi:gluconolactonase